jgi:hypothetical protein
MSSLRPDPNKTNSETRPLHRWERWGLDWAGQPIIEWDDEAHAAWCAKWAPRCPDGNPQRVRRAIAFRERNVCELELRVPLAFDENGACQVIFEESDDTVLVRVLVCFDPEREVFPRPQEFVDCPVRVWLDRPLATRTVVDVGSNEALPLHSPRYLTPPATQENPPTSSSGGGKRRQKRTDLPSRDP